MAEGCEKQNKTAPAFFLWFARRFSRIVRRVTKRTPNCCSSGTHPPHKMAAAVAPNAPPPPAAGPADDGLRADGRADTVVR